MNVQQQQQQFGDTTMTKVFVGGLAWETQKEAMREHFEKYGEILEAVIISDKITGRSKGYGFVTFKEAEAAKLACKDAAPVINGRRANCNLASLGARRPRSSTSQPGSMNGAKIVSSAPAVGSLQWYCPTGTPPPPFHPQQGIPFHAYGYSPGYFPEVAYDPKLGYCGSYVNGQFSHVYPGQGMVAQSVPVYPYFHYHHQSQGMGIPAAQIFPATTAGPITSIPAFIPKPPPTIAPNAGFWMQLKVQ